MEKKKKIYSYICWNIWNKLPKSLGGALESVRTAHCPVKRKPLRFYSSIQTFLHPLFEWVKLSQWIITWLPAFNSSGPDRYTTLGDARLGDAVIVFLTGHPLIYHLNKHSDGVTNLYQVEVWFVFIRDTEMVFLVPVTLPSGAQAAHTSVMDKHTRMDYWGVMMLFGKIRLFKTVTG